MSKLTERMRERQRKLETERECEKHAYLNQPKFSSLAQSYAQEAVAKERGGDREGERDRKLDRETEERKRERERSMLTSTSPSLARWPRAQASSLPRKPPPRIVIDLDLSTILSRFIKSSTFLGREINYAQYYGGVGIDGCWGK